MTTVPKQLNPFFETMITTESLHKLANFRNTKENLQIKRYYSNCLFTAATIDRPLQLSFQPLLNLIVDIGF